MRLNKHILGNIGGSRPHDTLSWCFYRVKMLLLCSSDFGDKASTPNKLLPALPLIPQDGSKAHLWAPCA